MMPPTTPQAPPLPPRHQHQQHVDDDEPPPAYTPSPDNDTTLLEVGPRYPFQPTQSTPSHPLHPTDPFNSLYSTQQPLPHNYPVPSSTPQFQSNPIYHQPPHQSPNSQYSQNYLPIPASSEPTSVPTPGRPLLFEDRILVYPYVNGVCYFCPKCCNTGFKGFDPSRPCRKCWLKYGKPWQVVRLSPMTNATRANLQRPLPPNGSINHQPPPLVVRPGDPRIGGRLCLNCNGSGSKPEEINLFNVFLGGGGSEVCPSCRGAGRVF